MMIRTNQLASIPLWASVLFLGLAGCEKKEAPAPQASSSGGVGMRSIGDDAAPARATAADLKLHPKVQFPDERIPESLELAQAIADLAGAIAGGSADALDAMISAPDRAVLKMLVDSGEWKRRSDAVRVVRVCVLNETPDLQVGFGIEDGAGAFLMGWSSAAGSQAWSFSNMPIEPRFAGVAKELDGAELKLLALPSGVPTAVAAVVPEETKEPAEKKDNPDKPAKRKAPPPPAPGTLRPDKH